MFTLSRSILSCGLLSTKKMIYYEISFPLTLIFKYIFVKILSLMAFISISLKTSNILENKSQVFERSDCTITAIIRSTHLLSLFPRFLTPLPLL